MSDRIKFRSLADNQMMRAQSDWRSPHLLQVTVHTALSVPTPAKQEPRNPMAEIARKLHPFFRFYGGKWRDTPKQYPPPTYDTIVEPFAGSAGYSLRYFDRRVILCEIDPVLASIWQYILRASPKEILSIPDVGPGESVDDLVGICQEAKWLVGMWLNSGVSRPCKTPSKWMRDGTSPKSFWGASIRERIASQLDAIRHWEIHNVDYAGCPHQGAATWFVDPPYQIKGACYKFGSSQIDYAYLAAWCRSRQGQVIVCENVGAQWMPFRAIGETQSCRPGAKSKEAYWLSGFE